MTQKTPAPASPEDFTLATDFVDRAETAVQKIRDVVRGNGFHPLEDVELLSYEEIEVLFEAENEFHLHTEQGEKLITSLPGSVQKVKTEADLKVLSSKDLDQVTAQPATLDALKAQILKREDRGFFWDRQRMGLPVEPLHYVREEPCQTCRGHKTIECVECHGKGWVRCPTCHGQKSGPAACTQCRGKGDISCVKCQNKGKRDCSKCKGLGNLNYLTQIKLSVDSAFSCQMHQIPEIARPIIERLKEKLITRGHAQVEISDDIDVKKKNPSGAVLTLHYDTRLPLGDLQVRIGEETVSALVFGNKTALLDVPPFLERYILGPLNLLREAAMGQGHIARKIRAATYQTRLTHDAVMGVLQAGAAKTEKKLRHDYSIALEPQFINSLIKAARGALDRLMIRPQIYGLGLGLIPAFIFTLLYIFGMASGGTGTPQPLRLLFDLICLGCVVFLPYLGAQLMSRQALIDALGETARHHLKLPKLGRQGLWGPAIAGLLFLLFSEIAFRENPQTAPQIYSVIRSLLP
ncbi:MAG: hypothetical protein H6855_02095 [Rhodospirillales bacterium]|nr:hypothetical protein [Rhodospirillales bacterium]